MAEVIATFRVMPKGVDIDLENLKKKITEKINPDRINESPVAFGLVALNVIKIIPDAGGEVDKIEDQLRRIEEISEVEITDLTRSL